MAKKQTMNLFEAHVEKLVALIALVVLAWVVVFKLMDPPAVELRGERIPATEAADQALRKSEELTRTLTNQSREGSPPAEIAQAPGMFEPGDTHFKLNKDLYNQNVIVKQQTDKREYLLPPVPDLREVKIDFTRGQAQASNRTAGGGDMGLGMGMGMEMGGMGTPPALTANLIDVDFVTVEAKFSMTDFYNAFEASLKGPDIAKPLSEYPAQPVVATVLLERRELLADGQWGDPVSVPFLSTNQALNLGALSIGDIEQMTPAVYEASFVRRAQAYQEQINYLQPIPYNMYGETWKPPSEKAAESTANTRTAGPGMVGGMDGMGMDPMGMGMGMGMGVGGMSGNLNTNDLKVWAHDNTVTPGAIYDYRISLGFFNPIYGKEWAGPGQEKLKNEKILWSKRGVPENAVQIPPRTVFFPKSASAGNPTEKVASVTVYHYQDGKWYDRSYRILPGSVIGSVEEVRPKTRPQPAPRPGQPRTPAAEEPAVSVDFRTGITVVDILPNSKRWLPGPSLTEQMATDILFRYPDGSVHRLGTEKNTWPENLSNAYTMIQKELRKQRDRESRSPNQRSGNMGMGMDPTGMGMGG